VLSLLLMLTAFKLSLNVAPGAMQLINMSVPMMAMLLLVLLPMVMIGTTLLTLISATVKSMKEAQGYMSVLMLLPMVPTLLLWVNPVRDELWQFAVPFLAQNQMIMKLVRGDMIGGAEWAVYVGAGLGTALLLWIVASRLYLSEKLAVSA
ncbi:MAG: ABC transporter permease, partial [Luteimonas sp.]